MAAKKLLSKKPSQMTLKKANALLKRQNILIAYFVLNLVANFGFKRCSLVP